MLLRFFREADQAEEPRREILTAARDLATLYPDEWRALLADAIRPRSNRRGASRKRRGPKRRRRR